GFSPGHARVIGTVKDEERRFEVREMIQRRSRLEPLSILDGITDRSTNDLSPAGRRAPNVAQKMARSGGDRTGRELAGAAGERRERDEASIASTGDTDPI